MSIEELLAPILAHIDSLSLEARVDALNETRRRLHDLSPFKDEPVDCVLWVRGAKVQANTYNPNRVAPPEMRLLETSIVTDGFTQPIVGCPTGDHILVVDGFHRNRVGKESEEVVSRLHGYLPVTLIRASQETEEARMASTIRHNRARGKHQVDAMTDIVLSLSKRNWSDKKIGKELGMEPDEVLRFKQIGGLAELFINQEFSEAWEINEEANNETQGNALAETS